MNLFPQNEAVKRCWAEALLFLNNAVLSKKNIIRFGFRQNSCSRRLQIPSDIHVAGNLQPCAAWILHRNHQRWNFQTLPSST